MSGMSISNRANLSNSANVSTGSRVKYRLKKEANKLGDTLQMGAALGATGVGYGVINKVMYNKSYAWNTSINEILKKNLKNMKDSINISINNPFTSSALKAENGKILIDKTHKAYKNLSFGKKAITNAVTKGVNFAQDVMEKLSKTSGRQKALGVFVGAAAIALLLLARKQGKKSGKMEQKFQDTGKI